MDARLWHEGVPLSSIRQINALPETARRAIYGALIPDSILDACYGGTRPLREQLSIEVRCPEKAGFFEIDARHPADARDPMIYVQMADTANGQLEVLLLIVNDPLAPRFDVDRDWQGRTIKYGTRARNLAAEVAAMRAGLAPGQVRRGLGWSRPLIPVVERFAVGLGKQHVLIEPLAYHNAILFERYGFAYMAGRARMEQIHRDFQPGSLLCGRLDGSTPFRQAGAEKTIRGRSWAIHDGILDEPWSGVRMYKRVGHDAGECTFPDAVY
jgi:hypothetical protein